MGVNISTMYTTYSIGVSEFQGLLWRHNSMRLFCGLTPSELFVLHVTKYWNNSYLSRPSRVAGRTLMSYQRMVKLHNASRRSILPYCGSRFIRENLMNCPGILGIWIPMILWLIQLLIRQPLCGNWYGVIGWNWKRLVGRRSHSYIEFLQSRKLSTSRNFVIKWKKVSANRRWERQTWAYDKIMETFYQIRYGTVCYKDDDRWDTN